MNTRILITPFDAKYLRVLIPRHPNLVLIGILKVFDLIIIVSRNALSSGVFPSTLWLANNSAVDIKGILEESESWIRDRGIHMKMLNTAQ